MLTMATPYLEVHAGIDKAPSTTTVNYGDIAMWRVQYDKMLVK